MDLSRLGESTDYEGDGLKEDAVTSHWFTKKVDAQLKDCSVSLVRGRPSLTLMQQ